MLGASVAGLLAARVLADSFDEVTVIERDPLPDESIARRSVPQAEHVHVLLAGGQVTLEDLFPGYGEELLTAGGLVVDGARDVNFYAEGDFLADGPRYIPLYCASRSLYEQIVRRHVAALDNVTLRGECQFKTYLVDETVSTIEAVSVSDRASGPERLAADLVVDATGRTSRTPTWLKHHGYDPPTVDEVSVELAYSTALVERPARDRRTFLFTASPPHPLGGAVQAIENDQWVVTLFGLHGVQPPTDLEEFVSFAASMPTPELGRLLEEHALDSDAITHYRFSSSRRRRYEDLERFPEGLVVVGDAIASFNPIYGQGMTVAAFEALHLHRTLSTGDRDDLARRFFERAGATVDIAWNMAVGSDHQFPQTTGPKPRGTDATGRYLARLLRRAHTDGTLSDAFFRVLMMERTPGSLVRPSIAWRVFKPTRPSPGSSLPRRHEPKRTR